MSLLTRLFTLASLLLVATPALSQDFDAFTMPGLGSGGSSFGEPVSAKAWFDVEEGSNKGRLYFEVTLEKDWHTFDVNQPSGSSSPQATDVSISKNDLVSVVEVKGLNSWKLSPDTPYKVKPPSGEPGTFDVDSYEHYDRVEWYANIEFADGVDPQTVKIEAAAFGQICIERHLANGDTEGECRLMDLTATAEFRQLYKPTRGLWKPKRSHVTWKIKATPKVVQPGGVVTVQFIAKPDVINEENPEAHENYHIYDVSPFDPDLPGVGKPTLIVFNQTFGSQPDDEPILVGRRLEKETGEPDWPTTYYYKEPVSWTYELKVPSGVEHGEHVITALLGFQTCTDNSCDAPDAAEVTCVVAVGEETVDGENYFEFQPAQYSAVAKVAEEKHQTFKEMLGWLGAAFLGGLILNVMPCVLPVIGLKVMSFVQQAGQKRGQILALNLWYTLGIVVVFWAFAGVAVTLRLVYGESLAWGAQFSNPAFTIPVCAVVFIFGLSLLGVWEIPLPGFVGSGSASKLAEKEGPAGAFFKGVLATLLATPCTGPFLGTALAFALGAPPIVTFLSFTIMGIGMASPYLLLGCFPALVNRIPRPGPWMETFKQVTGFILMATVVWLVVVVSKSAATHTQGLLSLLLALAVGCWLIGRLPLTASVRKKAFAWGTGLAINGLVILVAFFGAKEWVMPSYEIEWQEFAKAKVDDEVKQGNVVLVDFTADWCFTCKQNESLVLNTKPVKDYVDDNNVVSFKADKTVSSPHIDKALEELGNKDKAIPMLAIFPSDGGSPILLRGPVTQKIVLEALEKAGANGGEPNSAEPVEEPAATTAMKQ